MGFGITAYSPAGVTLIDQDRLGWALIDSFTIGDGVSTIKYYPQFAGRTVKSVAIKLTNGGGHIVTVSGTTVTITNSPYKGNYIVTGSPSVVLVYVR